MTIAAENSNENGAPPGAAKGASERGRSSPFGRVSPTSLVIGGIIAVALLVLVGIPLSSYLRARRGRLGLVPEPVDRPDIDLTADDAPIDLGLLGSTAARP